MDAEATTDGKGYESEGWLCIVLCVSGDKVKLVMDRIVRLGFG